MPLSVTVNNKKSDKQVNRKSMMNRSTLMQGSTAYISIMHHTLREYLYRSPVDMLHYIDDTIVVKKNTSHTQWYDSSNMKGIYASYFLPHNIHLVQLGHKNNLEAIVKEWIHTLIDESAFEVHSTPSHPKEFLKNKNSS